ncbi:MAG TPA: hypothetical protein H9880_03700, partial [Candidatus Anaerobutyricum avicola]|nr:hypothetical protein [Candidatus Anaerobutyricum avicola]
LNLALKLLLCLDIVMNPLFRIDFSISDSLKIVRKSVLIYETIILAAAFLEEFIDEGVEWIHLDIAGSSDFSDEKPYMAKGATGVLVRTLGEMFR